MGKLTKVVYDLRVSRAQALAKPPPKAFDGRRRDTCGPEIIGALGDDVITLGMASGNLFGFHTRFEPHLILSGKSGSGKTKTMHMFTAGLAKQRAKIIAVDPKGSDLEIPKQMGIVASAKTAKGWLNVLDYALDEVERRQQCVTDYIDVATSRFVEKYWEIPGSDPDLWIIVEEAAAVIGKGSGLSPQQRAELFSKLWDLTQRGRSAGVHVVFVVQLGTLVSFGGDNGNGIRTSAAARICHDRNPENLKAMFDASEPATLEVIKRVEQGSHGRVAFSYLDSKNGAAVRSGQIALLKQPEFVRSLKTYDGPGPDFLDFDNLKD